MTILLCDRTQDATVEAEGRTLLIHHKDFEPPQGDWTVVQLDSVRNSVRDWLSGYDSLIFVGLSRAITPGNRLDIIWEILFNKTVGLRKISVDTDLFINEPWRSWFHFGFVGATYRNYAHSFIAESQYNQFLDGIRDGDPFSIEEITRWGNAIVRSSRESRFPLLEVAIHPVSESAKAEYIQLKVRCFNEESSPKRIVARLEEFAISVCPVRSLPSPRTLWSKGVLSVVATDLPVDTWLTHRLQSMVSLANGIAREFSSCRP